MKIAILGTRGIPAHYGGFETFAEELSERLARHGHDVTVYGCKKYMTGEMKSYKGVTLAALPSFHTKHFEKPVLSMLSVFCAAKSDADILFCCGVSGAFFAWFAKLFKKKIVTHVDGLEWRRKKWGGAAKFIFRLCERVSVIFSDALVTDCKSVKNYYLEKYKKEIHCISYGTRIPSSLPSKETLPENLKYKKYFLFTCRMDEDSEALEVISAFKKGNSSYPLVLIGDAPYDKNYVHKVKNACGNNIFYLGSLYGSAYDALLHHAFAFIYASRASGLHPAILEAMGAGIGCLVRDTDDNREALKDFGLYFTDEDELAQKVTTLSQSPENAREMGSLAQEHAKTHYDWDKITLQFQELFSNLM